MIHNENILFDDFNTGHRGVLRLRKRPVIKNHTDLLKRQTCEVKTLPTGWCKIPIVE